jgi:hypothetical protein
VVTKVRVGSSGLGPHAAVLRWVSMKVSVRMPTAWSAWVPAVEVVPDPPEHPTAVSPIANVAAAALHRFCTPEVSERVSTLSSGTISRGPNVTKASNGEHDGGSTDRHGSR